MSEAIDAAHLTRQRDSSLRNFGPDQTPTGVLDHIRKELVEIGRSPGDITEWADLLLLAFDGAMRAHHEPQDIIDAVKAKQAANEQRAWPDWRTQDPNKAIEHVRDDTPEEGEDRADDVRTTLEHLRTLAERVAAAFALINYDAHPVYANTSGWRGGIGGAAITRGCSLIDPPPDADWTQFDLPSGPLRAYLDAYPFDLGAAKDALKTEFTRAVQGDR